MKAFLLELWSFILISAPYLLLGFLISGLINTFINKEFIKKILSKNSKWDVLWAAFLGVPLPLCSCSVVPTAATLRKSGASNGSTSAFLISTPESGVDSIMFTYAVLDLPMTIIRPIVAFITAFLAGVLNNQFNEFILPEDLDTKESCCHKKEAVRSKLDWKTVFAGIKYGFVDLLDDMVGWLSVGIILGALIGVLIPENFFLNFDSYTSRLIILLIGIPTYICASASTPVAASLILKGLSPGAALIFLMVGPATNISNMAVIQKYIGKKGLMINLFSIAFVSLLASYIVDYLYSEFFELNLKFSEHQHHVENPGVFTTLLGIAFCLLVLSSLARTYIFKPHSH